MRYKDIARSIILKRGTQEEVTAEDGHEFNPSGRPFTAKQLDKVQEAFDTSVEWLKKKWKIEDAD